MSTTDEILKLLVLERDKLNRAIEALSGSSSGVKRRGRPPKNPLANAPDWVLPAKKKAAEKPARGKRTWSAAQKKAAAERMKARWAAKKKAAK
ncbi:MAG TPA: hypothetical protein VGN17_01060 [Bryobacteraceae bacterium]|jgi:hypothetical protein